MMDLTGRNALVTGVSRRAGIGYAITRRLQADGATVFIHGWTAHDARQTWGAEPGGLEQLAWLMDRAIHATSATSSKTTNNTCF